MSDNTKAIQPAQEAPKDLVGWLALPQIRARLNDISDGGGATLTASIINAANANRKIYECEPISVINAALNLFVLGLSVSPNLGQGAIVPFGGKNGMKAVPMVMKNGLVQLALTSGKYRTLHVSRLYEGESWEENRLTGELTLQGHRESSKVVGYTAYLRLMSGYEKYLYMSVDEILAHGKKYSRSFDDANGYWKVNQEAMCEKTVMRQLLLKYGVLSPGARKMIESGDEAGMEIITDAVISDPVEPPAPPKSEAEIMRDLGY